MSRTSAQASAQASTQPSQWRKWITEPGNIRVVAIEGTSLVKELFAQQETKGLGQLGYAEAVLSSLLIASAHKSNESINMNAQGSGLFRQAIIDASTEGKVRGFLIEQSDKAKHSYGEHGTNGPWGSGVLSVLYTKNFEGKTPYTGMVPISTGFLDEAVNDYYRDSEQLPSVIGLAIEFSGTEVTSARGALIQTLGGADAQEIEQVHALTLKSLRALASHADDFAKFESDTTNLLGGKKLKVLETTPLVKFCNCSQERIERALKLTGEEDAMHALGDSAYIEMTCDFCRTTYRVARERIKALFSSDPSRLQ